MRINCKKYSMSNVNHIRAFTLCSGYDAQLLALKRLSRNYPSFSYECVGWSEIDRYACKAHDALHPEAAGKNLGDMRKIDWAIVPDFDLLTYSTPCQSISVAGRREGLAEGSGTASSLLWYTRNAIAAKRPKYLVMENVKALVSEKFLPFLHKWQEELEGYGYTNFTKVLNARDYGVPQNRERVFMVSILGGVQYFFPEKIPETRCLRDVLEENVNECYYLSDTLLKGFLTHNKTHAERGNGFFFAPRDPSKAAGTVATSSGHRVDDNYIACVAINGTESSNALTTVQKDNVILSYSSSRDAKKNDTFLAVVNTEGEKAGIVIGSSQANAYHGSIDGASPTITAACGMGGGQVPMITESKMPSLRIRKLTPRECFRLMDVDEEDTNKLLQSRLSRTQLYKMAGNSIVVACLYHLFRKLFVETECENGELGF